MTHAPESIARFFLAYADAVRHKDAKAFASLYTPDVSLFDAWDSWHQQGAAHVLAAAGAWFASLGTETVEISLSDVRVRAEPTLACVSALVTYAAVSAEGQPLRSMVNRASFVLVQDGGAWRISHEHTSVPVDFMSRQAVPVPSAAGSA